MGMLHADLTINMIGVVGVGVRGSLQQLGKYTDWDQNEADWSFNTEDEDGGLVMV